MAKADAGMGSAVVMIPGEMGRCNTRVHQFTTIIRQVEKLRARMWTKIMKT